EFLWPVTLEDMKVGAANAAGSDLDECRFSRNMGPSHGADDRLRTGTVECRNANLFHALSPQSRLGSAQSWLIARKSWQLDHVQTRSQPARGCPRHLRQRTSPRPLGMSAQCAIGDQTAMQQNNLYSITSSVPAGDIIIQ